MIKIYTDGSCRRTGIGGYGYIVVEDDNILARFVRREKDTTNQRMELKALIEAYRYCKNNNIIDGEIHSDSAYCLNCAFEKWYINWEKNNFISSKGNKVKNQDLWIELIPFFKESAIKLVKVKGHSTNFYNNVIDSLVTTISNSATEDLFNRKFGKLTVLGLYGNKFTEGINSTFWLCECECGRTKVVSHANLHSGGVTSCGICLSERYEDLTGQIFGFLKPIEKIGIDNQKYAVWKCECSNCGSFTQVSSRLLKKGQMSCGCIKSKGETRIGQILQTLNIPYQREFKFNDCKDKDKLKFDFAIFDKDGNIKCLIEYQGIQHYYSAKNSSSWNTIEHLSTLQKHDKLKREFCNKKEIPLIEIPYSNYDKINAEYIKEVMKL